MFHPLYNEDGRISYFRLSCLIIVTVSMFSYGVITLSRDEAPLISENMPEPAPAAEAVLQEPEIDPLALALDELAEGSGFLSACGLLNQGFEGCDYSFSPQVLEFFEPGLEVSDDGYALELHSRDRRHCSVLRVMNGVFESFDERGQPASGCIPPSYARMNLDLAGHDFDQLVGQDAPSGIKPLFTQTADVSVLTSNKDQL